MSLAERVRQVRSTCGISEIVDKIVPTVPKIPIHSSSISGLLEFIRRYSTRDAVTGQRGRLSAFERPPIVLRRRKTRWARALRPGTTVPDGDRLRWRLCGWRTGAA
jgi:hypothetical protein